MLVFQLTFFSNQKRADLKSSNFSLLNKAALEHYFRENNRYPEKIFIYRDGVGDGQLAAVKESEIPQIQKAFALIDINYK